MRPIKIKAILFDLDDTLYDQKQHLIPAFMKVSEYLENKLGISKDYAFKTILDILNQEGSASGRIFDMLLYKIGFTPDKSLIHDLIRVFYSYKPETLVPFDDVVKVLSELKMKGYKLGIITDGFPELQKAKIKALNLEKFLDVVVVSDEYGRSYRKPNVFPYLLALQKIGVDSLESVYVGDNPLKDFYGANKLGMVTIRIKRGEYSKINVDGLPIEYRPKYEIEKMEEILAILKSLEG